MGDSHKAALHVPIAGRGSIYILQQCGGRACGATFAGRQRSWVGIMGEQKQVF